MRILRHHSILRCIYALLIALPMFSVLGRVIYTQSNHNAKDSYAGNTIRYEYNLFYEYQTNEVNSINDLVVGNIYKFTNYVGDNFVLNVDVIYYLERPNNDIILDVLSYENMYVSRGNIVGGQNTVSIQDGSNFYFVYKSYTGVLDSYIHKLSSSNFLGKPQVEINTINESTLDNAFDYSLSTFVDENHWGKINFFDWFTSLFVDINYNNNALYLHFINWYMNYAMLVSCAYILFLVLMWFINFSRRLLERGMNYDW